MKTFKTYFALALWVQVLILHLAILADWDTPGSPLWLARTFIAYYRWFVRSTRIDLVIGGIDQSNLTVVLSIPPLLLSAFVGLLAYLIKDFRKPLP